MRHIVQITFEDTRQAFIVIDEDDEVSVRGLRNIREIVYRGIPRHEEEPS